MNAAVMMKTCPDLETLAAFIDGRLDEQTRQEIIVHAVDCPECEDKIVATNEYLSTLEPANLAEVVRGEEVIEPEYDSSVKTAPDGEVVRGRFGTRVLAPLLAAAAVVAVVFGVPSIREKVLPKSPMEELVAAANGRPERPTEARLSGDFDYKPPQRVNRGGEEKETTEYDMQILALKRAERAEKNRSAENLHQLGVADLFVPELRRDAVPALEGAAKASPNSPDVLTDLTAAYLAQGNYPAAYSTAEKAWSMQQSPITAWNRALALERLERQTDAIAAWKKYLELDSNSEWSAEAKRKLDDLQNY